MQNVQLTKSSSESDLKRYFTAVLELSKSDNQFPINLDEVWMLVYERRDKAFNSLRRHFFEGEDFYLTQMGKVVTFKELQNGVKAECFLSVSCMEYFIARKVRPVFEVYRQVFHRTTSNLTLPQNYSQALRELLSKVEENERLQERSDRLQERSEKHFKGLVVAESLIKDQEKIIKEQKKENEKLAEEVQTQQNIINLQCGELDTLAPKGRIYDQVIQSVDSGLCTTSSVANEIGMSGQRLNLHLIACGIIYKAKNGDYLFTSEYLKWNLGRSVSKIVNPEMNSVKTYIKWNTRGRAYIHALHDTKWDKRRAWHIIKKGNELETA